MPTGDGDFEELYRAHGSRLVVQLFAYAGDLGLAQDVVQEAFCRALARWSRVSGYDDPIGWIRRVAMNLATSHWRRAARTAAQSRSQRAQVVPGPEPNEIALLDALSSLPAGQRRAVIMHYLNDMSIADIAAAEQASPNTIKQRLHRARAALGERLAESTSEVGHA